MTSLALVPVTLREANAYVLALHRHHAPARGCIFCLGFLKAHVHVANRDAARMALVAGIGAMLAQVRLDERAVKVRKR